MLLSCQIPTTVPFPEMAALAQLADKLGYDTVTCSHIAARDSFTALSGLAMVTERVHLATAVAPIYHRSPASMAQTAATVDDLSGGRFRLGLGAGHRVTMGGWHGQEIGRPVPEMREYVELVRALLTGAEPPQGKRWNSTFRFTAFEPRPDIPVLLAGLSPAMLRLAGEIADGVVLWACPADYVRDVVVPEVAKGRAAAGKTLDGFAVMPAIPVAAGSDRTQALAVIRSELHRYFGLPFYRSMFAAAGYAEDLRAYDEATGDQPRQEQTISENLIDALCAIGDVAQVRDGIARYRAAGATNPILTGIRGTEFASSLRAAAG
ncbi:LLM class flavin-dependent oxidoreductase [Kutzneria sp. CA-103260]|uniref:LLM class flavin-dependent oxidoreductase n=1 Tax=Kutzneria sp. CA-103260 TaxID=2802641 RepID=UPI001BAB446E|nr:LLM class flavin-dependent oxidoreductase [Kutzneria sp. CA-103260]QUQ63677.1 LLM class F420-dependent oxidoreductase [Kutzneria sp. CA-103260]